MELWPNIQLLFALISYFLNNFLNMLMIQEFYQKILNQT